MARNHVSQGTDHISKLAADGGFEHWKTVWDENGSLSSKRSNPNMLFKGDRLHPQGDVVKIPDHDAGSVGAAVDAHHPFTTSNDKLFLRLRILKDDFSALANAKYTLTVEGALAPFTGSTNPQGQLEQEIPRASTQGTLTVSVTKPAPASGSSGGGASAEAPVTWQLQIGRLNPIMENAPDRWCISGVQQRLNNLGISSGPIDGIKGRLTEAAIKSFQHVFGLTEDGKPGQGETQPKLQDAHDKPDSVLGPKPPPNDSQQADTPDEAYGHVCPDFDDRKVFNTLRIRSSYRLTLRLGSFEEIFPHAPNTPEGRMERMQVVGLFYFPLRHNKALQAFNGLAATATEPAFRGCWEYFKTRILNAATDADADQEIQRLLREWIVAGGTLPPVPAEGAAPADANFTKLHIPGGYGMLVSWRTNALNVNQDTAAPYNNWTLGATLYDVETRFRADNPILGKIPFVALVERFDASDSQWKPAADATVFFQLVDPYALPAFDATKPVNQQFNRPALRSTSMGPPAAAANAGPARFAAREENPTGARAPNATDPQRGNCPQDRGGKQGFGNQNDGSDVAGHLFLLDSTPGFNAAHKNPTSGTVNPITRTVFFPQPERVNDATRKHCVKAKTNANGEAGVIFLPSRCGGDRYRLRAFLGPPTINGAGSDGEGNAALRVETGTFVNWRHVRISRYVRQPAANVDPVLLADAQNNAQGFNLGAIVMPAVNTATDYLQRLFIVDGGGTNRGLNTCDFSFNVPAPGGFDPLPVQWARAFVEVEIDRAAQGALPEDLNNDDWERARAQGIRDGVRKLGTFHLSLNLDQLFYFGPAKPASLNVSNAVVHMPMRSIPSYNALVPGNRRINNATGNTLARIQDWIGSIVIPGFIRSLASNGYTPGFTIIQSSYGCTWTMFHDDPEGNYSDSSGESTDVRATDLWAGGAAYPTAPVVPRPAGLPWANYGFTSNVCHELGHDHFCLHSNPPEPGSAWSHDPTASNRSVCLMSYQNCEGHYCAKCLFALRGWDVTKLT